MLKRIIRKIAFTFALFIGIILLVLGGFYLENQVFDKSILPTRNTKELFTDSHFQDSILENSIKGEYFVIVQNYLQYMIVNGRDRYGKEHSPLFATTLDRTTGNAYSHHPPKPPKGIRERDRTWRGANHSSHSGLYGLLYEMTHITGDKRYALEADKGIQWFWKNCQIERTGLMPWGEHMGWDFFKERPILWKFQFWTHELKGYPFWDKVWEMDTKAAENFALGLWRHQIYSQKGDKAGEYSRHSNAFLHYPLWGKGFPGHGGKYIEIWARAWNETGKQEFLYAINTLLNYFDKNSSAQSGAIPYATKFPEHYSLGHNMGLAASLYKAKDLLPDTFAIRMKQMADSTDPLYLSFNHDPVEGGKGFVKSAHLHTLVPGEYRSEHKGGRFRTQMWSSGYGAGNTIGQANSCLDRYYQTGIEEYKELFLITAEAYYHAEIPEAKILYPKNYSGIIGMMRKACKITGERRFLDKALEYADRSVTAIMDDSSPLPKASNKDEHFEAITGANGFMSSLLGLWKDLNAL